MGWLFGVDKTTLSGVFAFVNRFAWFVAAGIGTHGLDAIFKARNDLMLVGFVSLLVPDFRLGSFVQASYWGQIVGHDPNNIGLAHGWAGSAVAVKLESKNWRRFIGGVFTSIALVSGNSRINFATPLVYTAAEARAII